MRRFLLLLLVSLAFCMFFLSSGSISFASIDYNTFVESNYNGTKLELVNEACTNTFGIDLNSIEFVGVNQSTFNGYRSDLISDVNNSSFVTFYISTYSKFGGSGSDYGPGIEFKFSTSSDFNGGTYHSYTIKYYRGNAGMTKTVYNNQSQVITGSLDTNNTNRYLFANNKYYNAIENSYNIESGIKFIPFNNNTTTISGILVHLENFSRSVLSWRLGTLENYDNDSKGYIDIYNGSSWDNIGNLVWDSNGGVYVNNNRVLYYQAYRVYFHDKDYNYTDMFCFYFLPYGESYNNQGLVYSGNDNNNDIPIMQQNQENQDFWKDTYNNLFSLNSGDVGEIAALVESYFPSGDMLPISIFDMIMGSVNNDPSDFIIRWDDIGINTTLNRGEDFISGDIIQSGSINFSKYCRDNDTLGVIHTWIIIFAVVSFYILYCIDFYRCVLIIIGTNGLIDAPEEEHRQIGFINDWRDKQ